MLETARAINSAYYVILCIAGREAVLEVTLYILLTDNFHQSQNHMKSIKFIKKFSSFPNIQLGSDMNVLTFTIFHATFECKHFQIRSNGTSEIFLFLQISPKSCMEIMTLTELMNNPISNYNFPLFC